MSELVVRRSPRLLGDARSVFGDIVSAAWLTTHKYEDTYTQAIGDLDRAEAAIHIDKSGSLNYDAETIWLLFSNGQLVEFNNSEWASIHAVSGETLQGAAQR